MTTSLPVHVERRLLSYALLAGAGMVAGSQPANATIVYVDIPDVVVAPNDSYVLNIGGPGGGSFTFYNFAFTDTGTTLGSLLYLAAWVRGVQAGDAIVTGGAGFALYMSTSYYVGGSWAFAGGPPLGIYHELFGGLIGSIVGVGPKMIGVKFVDGGDTYYGWIRISVMFTPGVGFTTIIYDYAYETKPTRQSTSSLSRNRVAWVFWPWEPPGWCSRGCEGANDRHRKGTRNDN